MYLQGNIYQTRLDFTLVFLNLNVTGIFLSLFWTHYMVEVAMVEG